MLTQNKGVHRLLDTKLKLARVVTSRKIVLNDLSTMTKIVHNDSFSVIFQSLWISHLGQFFY